MFTITKLVEVNANDLWDTPTHVNARFCGERCRASGSEGSLFLMDGKNYQEKVEEAKDYGCTSAFIAAYEQAIQMGAELVLFCHDV